ncbi:MAG: hypothetical protein CMJ29_09285 [Phycisphaerae bacterium]|nr:hypothetical protein [Phycisphaerae bacterium]
MPVGGIPLVVRCCRCQFLIPSGLGRFGSLGEEVPGGRVVAHVVGADSFIEGDSWIRSRHLAPCGCQSGSGGFMIAFIQRCPGFSKQLCHRNLLVLQGLNS